MDIHYHLKEGIHINKNKQQGIWKKYVLDNFDNQN